MRITLLILLCLGAVEVFASALKVTPSVSGPSGLVEVPNARMLEDGEFAIHLSATAPYQRYSIIGQPLPWLQVLFKYTDIENVLYGASIAGSQSYKDKSTDVKVFLREESYYLPALAIGINDIGGTGLFSGEYLVASKQFKNIDLTLGLGWGYLGQQGQVDNPLSFFSDSFRTRKTNTTSTGGTVDPGVFFSGERVSVFGGAEYHFKKYPLLLKFEYDANNYKNEPQNNDISQVSPFNLGAVYSPSKAIDFHFGYVRGNTAMLGVTFRTNFKSTGPKKIFDPAPVAVVEDESSVTSDWEKVSSDLRKNAGYQIVSVSQEKERLFIKGKQKLFLETAQGIGRASRILANSQPKKIEKFVFVETFNGLDVSAIEIDRNTFEKAAKLEKNSKTILASTKFTPASFSKKEFLHYNSNKKAFNYQIRPDFSGSFGGPDEFLLYQISMNANASYFLKKNTWFSGSLQLGLIDNYDQFKYTAPSRLPRVRTNIKEYLKTSRLRLNNLQLSNLTALSDDLFVMSYAGYLEAMYGGIGAEILYRPYGKQWALGLDMNYVKQRDFDQGFGFRKYSVVTGNLTGYYEMDNNILVKVSAGQYLAKDKGVTIDLSRKFRSGAQMGFWATKTDVTAEQFGEGSFDKGFYFSIPLNLFSFQSTTDITRFKWQFLTRDGGQKLNKSLGLYGITNSRISGYLKKSFENILR